MSFHRGAWMLATCLLICADIGWAADIPVRLPHSGAYSLRVTSLKEARFKTTIPQQYDFSCGSAALATLLTHHYARPVGEQEVLREMYAPLLFVPYPAST